MVNKSKKSKRVEQPISAQQMIKTRMRKVELGKCYRSKGFGESGEGSVVVTHEHTGGNISLAVFLIDTYCLGLKDSFYVLRMDPATFKETYTDDFLSDFEEISYNEAHNYIYGAIAFAEEAGIVPHPSFSLTQFFLKEDTEDIPLIDYDFGRYGQHFLIASSSLELSRYLPKLKKNLGDRFDYIVLSDNFENDKEEDKEEEDFYKDLEQITPEHINEMFEKSNLFKKFGEDTPYAYQRPEYPQNLDLNHPCLTEILFRRSPLIYLKDAEIKKILSLPQDTLRKDLESIVLYGMGQAEKPSPEAEGIMLAVIHAIILLGEVGDENSLEVVLETLRQPQKVSDQIFGDLKEDIFTPTIYKLAQNRLERLKDFAREPGLHTDQHFQIYPAVSMIATLQPQRRNEVINWYKDIMNFAVNALPDNSVIDSTMVAYIICEIEDFKGVELLPEIKALYDTECVELGICGKFDVLKNDILNQDEPYYTYDRPLDLYGRYKYLKRLLS